MESQGYISTKQGTVEDQISSVRSIHNNICNNSQNSKKNLID